jgi:hypothetical protein
MSSQDRTQSVLTRGGMRSALWGGAILTISLGFYVGTASRSVGQTGTSTADVCTTDAKSDTLQEFARKCADAVGEDVPAFDCDAGTAVPETHLTGSYPNGVCDAPNVLNGECDPDSRFQVLKETNDVAIVGHCRKKGNGQQYGDIAVIQYNKKNGATCFYQALAFDPPSTGPLPAKVTAPSAGNGPGNFPWLDPAVTAGINCVRCHDNGPFIRSPYLAQLRGETKNRLPGTNSGTGPWDQRFSWNQTLPLSFVGNDFQSWKTYALSITGAGSGCLGCHRLGFSQSNGVYNAGPANGGTGTAQKFALIATAMHQAQKNPHSAASPIWMTPGQITYSAANETEAQAAAACARAIVTKLNDPSAPSPPQGCQYSQFGRGNSCIGGPIQVVLNGATQSSPTGGRTDVTVPLGACSDPGKCPPGFCYWRSVHGPLWQTTPFSVAVADTNYRGSFIRIYGENGQWTSRAFSDTTGLPSNAPPGGVVECTNYNEIAAVPNVSKCFANQFAILDKNGGTSSDNVNATVAGASTANVLSGLIGNIAQTNTGAPQEQPDTLRVAESSGVVQLSQLHGLKPPSPLKLGPLKGESWTNGCVSWTATYLAKDVHTTSDVQLLDPTQTKNARCFITGVTGAWSSTSNNATVQPYAEIYFGAANEARLRVSPTSGTDRVGAYASCIKLK